MPSRAAPSCSTALRIITTASTIRRSRSTSTPFLFMRGAGPIGYPGSAEVVNMQPPAALIKKGVDLACLYRRWPPVGNIGLAVDPQCIARSGRGRRARVAADRRSRAHRSQQGHCRYFDFAGRIGGARAALKKNGGYHYPPSETPWQEIQRAMVDQLGERHGFGACDQISARRAKVRPARQSLKPPAPSVIAPAFVAGLTRCHRRELP